MAKKGAKKAAAAVKDATKAMKAAEDPKAMKTMTVTVRTNAILDREMCLYPSRRPPAGREAWSPRSWHRCSQDVGRYRYFYADEDPFFPFLQ